MRPRWLMVIGDMKATCRIREPGCHTPDGVCVSHGLVVKREMTRWRNWSGVKRSSIFAPADGFLHSTFTRRLTTPPSLPVWPIPGKAHVVGGPLGPHADPDDAISRSPEYRRSSKL